MIGDVTDDGYSFRHVARSGQRGGRVWLLFKKTMSVRMTPIKTRLFESLDACITSDGIIVGIIVLYRLHPKHKQNGVNGNLFLTEIGDLLSKHILLPGKSLFLGDFNINWNMATDGNTLKLNDILDSFRLKQSVSVPTHVNGNMLDLVISSDGEDFVGNVTVNSIISDHGAVVIKLPFNKPDWLRKRTNTGNIEQLMSHSYAQIVFSLTS